MDMIKVSANSRTSAVAGAIAGVIREHHRAEVQAIGAGAVNKAVKALVLATGYEDGCILLVRLTDGSELFARHPTDGSRVTALAWDRDAKRLAFGCEDGRAGILTLPA